MDPFIGEIRALPYNFAPYGWAFCTGAQMSVSQNTALFSLLGVQFGGDGRTTFALPNLTNRCVIGPGHGPGLSTYTQAYPGGTATVTITENQMASHDHTMMAATDTASQTEPTDQLMLAKGPGDVFGSINYYTTENPTTNLSTAAIGVAGQAQAHENRQPYLNMFYFISLLGVYPPRPNT